MDTRDPGRETSLKVVTNEPNEGAVHKVLRGLGKPTEDEDVPKAYHQWGGKNCYQDLATHIITSCGCKWRNAATAENKSSLRKSP